MGTLNTVLKVPSGAPLYGYTTLETEPLNTYSDPPPCVPSLVSENLKGCAGTDPPDVGLLNVYVTPSISSMIGFSTPFM